MQDYRFDTDFLPARVARLAAQTPAATALVDTDGALLVDTPTGPERLYAGVLVRVI